MLGDELEQAFHAPLPRVKVAPVVERLPAVRAARDGHVGARRVDLPHLERERAMAQCVGAAIRDDAATAAAAEGECAAVLGFPQFDAERAQNLARRLDRTARRDTWQGSWNVADAATRRTRMRPLATFSARNSETCRTRNGSGRPSQFAPCQRIAV